MEISELSNMPGMTERALKYFYNCWSKSLDYSFVRDCIVYSFERHLKLPKFYILHDDSEIIGSYALLNNDLISRQDLMPWFGCLYINQSHRNQGLAGKLIRHGIEETRNKGFEILYLKTLLVGFYEKRGWIHICNGRNTNGQERKIYSISTMTTC